MSNELSTAFGYRQLVEKAGLRYSMGTLYRGSQSRGAPVGTTRQWGPNRYVKTADGSWHEVHADSPGGSRMNEMHASDREQLVRDHEKRMGSNHPKVQDLKREHAEHAVFDIHPESHDHMRAQNESGKIDADRDRFGSDHAHRKHMQRMGNMAQAITHPDKAARRGNALREAGFDEAAKLFYARHRQLTGRA